MSGERQVVFRVPARVTPLFIQIFVLCNPRTAPSTPMYPHATQPPHGLTPRCLPTTQAKREEAAAEKAAAEKAAAEKARREAAEKVAAPAQTASSPHLPYGFIPRVQLRAPPPPRALMEYGWWAVDVGKVGVVEQSEANYQEQCLRTGVVVIDSWVGRHLNSKTHTAHTVSGGCRRW